MNSTQAKKLSLVDFLSSLNLEPKNIKNNDYWYFSPLHSENTPSFKIDIVKNVWYDHGAGIGGNVIDLVMNIYNIDFTSALKKLSSIFDYGDTQNFSFFHQQDKIRKIKEFAMSKKDSSTGVPKFELKKVKALENNALIEYINKRGISSELAIKYLDEVYYQHDTKNYFALGFKNDSGNYELRNAYFKGCIGSKDITTIKGTENTKLSIFEGFMDFLSALTHFKIDTFKSDVVILNSVANKSKIEDLLYSDLYKKIYLFLDNDKAGEDTKRELYNINSNCIDCSVIYKDYKDFNDFIQR
jgi:DNA primase